MSKRISFFSIFFLYITWWKVQTKKGNTDLKKRKKKVGKSILFCVFSVSRDTQTESILPAADWLGWRHVRNRKKEREKRDLEREREKKYASRPQTGALNDCMNRDKRNQNNIILQISNIYNPILHSHNYEFSFKFRSHRIGLFQVR